MVVASCEKQRFALETSQDGQLLIRANQGHSIKTVEVEMEEITNHVHINKAIHGTYHKSWEIIRTMGLSRMDRNHIHFAAGEPEDAEVISGMRSSCQIYIYIDVEAAMREGIKFFRSSNNVILSPGNDEGIIKPNLFLQVVDVKKNEIIFPTYMKRSL